MSITINGTTNTLTAASGLAIAGNTAVTGTLSATGKAAFGGAALTAMLNVTADSSATNPVLWTDSHASGCAWYLGPGAGSGTRGDFNFYDATNVKLPLVIVKNGGGITSSVVTSVTDVTDATSTTAASLKTAGGLAVAKKLYVGGQAAIGVSVNALSSLTVSRTTTDTNQIAYYTGITGESNATAGIFGGIFSPTTGAAITTANVVGLRLGEQTKFAGSTITFQRGLEVLDLTQGATIYGADLQVSSGTGKWNLYASGTANNYMAGNLVMASGKGIDFSAYTDGSVAGTTDSQLFDDYEEGTFTPEIAGDATAGAGTYATQVGKYTKIGNRMFFSINISWSAHTGTGNMKLVGLPFTSENTAGLSHAVVATYVQNLTLTANNILTPYIGANEAVIWLNQSPIGAGGSVTQVPMDTAALFGLSGSYSV